MKRIIIGIVVAVVAIGATVYATSTNKAACSADCQVCKCDACGNACSK